MQCAFQAGNNVSRHIVLVVLCLLRLCFPSLSCHGDSVAACCPGPGNASATHRVLLGVVLVAMCLPRGFPSLSCHGDSVDVYIILNNSQNSVLVGKVIYPRQPLDRATGKGDTVPGRGRPGRRPTRDQLPVAAPRRARRQSDRVAAVPWPGGWCPATGLATGTTLPGRPQGCQCRI